MLEIAQYMNEEARMALLKGGMQPREIDALLVNGSAEATERAEEIAQFHEKLLTQVFGEAMKKNVIEKKERKPMSPRNIDCDAEMQRIKKVLWPEHDPLPTIQTYKQLLEELNRRVVLRGETVAAAELGVNNSSLHRWVREGTNMVPESMRTVLESLVKARFVEAGADKKNEEVRVSDLIVDLPTIAVENQDEAGRAIHAAFTQMANLFKAIYPDPEAVSGNLRKWIFDFTIRLRKLAGITNEWIEASSLPYQGEAEHNALKVIVNIPKPTNKRRK